MARRVRKFVDRAFSRTVDLELLKRLLEPYAVQIGFDWLDLPSAENDQREAIFELFRNADGRFPAGLQFTLFNISTLSTEAGARLLQLQADDRGVQLPMDEAEGSRDARHLNPRHLALVAWLDHRVIFDCALDAAAFYAHSARMERSGRREGVAVHRDPQVRARFEAAIGEYFKTRYQGRYCDVRWYGEDDSERALVLHGSKASIKNVDVDGAEASLKFREIVQDTLEYDTARGSISIGSNAAPDARMLADLFATHMLGEPDFFQGSEAGNLYTLLPINHSGASFRFNHDWDEVVTSVRLREIQVDEGEHYDGGRKRYSPWAMTVRDKDDALRRLAELAPDIDFADLRITYVKLEFMLGVGGAETSVIVKVKPPGLASFRDHSHESTILEHLERNGLRRTSPAFKVPAAAE